MVGALAVGVSGNLAAQQGVALTPYIGYLSPMGNLVDQNNSSCCLTVKAKPGIQVGAIGELNMSKHFAISAFAASTVGLTQTAEFNFNTASTTGLLKLGLATTQFGGTFIIRPLGRNPNGSPKVFFLEAGAAYTRLSFSDVQDRTNGNTASPSWGWSGGMGVFGGGFTFRVGPRSTLVLFGRYNMMLSTYSSAGLDDWNSQPPPDTPKKSNMLFFGAGLRTGR
jgi:hypothetical protein